MKTPPKVLCNRFAECGYEICTHHAPHNKRIYSDDYFCSKWVDCTEVDCKVRCVKATLIA